MKFKKKATSQRLHSCWDDQTEKILQMAEQHMGRSCGIPIHTCNHGARSGCTHTQPTHHALIHSHTTHAHTQVATHSDSEPNKENFSCSQSPAKEFDSPSMLVSADSFCVTSMQSFFAPSLNGFAAFSIQLSLTPTHCLTAHPHSHSAPSHSQATTSQPHCTYTTPHSHATLTFLSL